MSLVPAPSRPRTRRPPRPALRVARTQRIRVIDPARFRARRRAVRIPWRRLVILGVALYALGMTARAVSQWKGLTATAARVQAQIHTVDARNRSLSTTLARLNSAAYTEQSARQELGYAFPGELSFTPVQGR